MGYYNWGEQVGNSFMTMLAQNQQKKLEEKRLGMEKQRVDMAGRQLEDQLETSEVQRELFAQEMKQREYEMGKAREQDTWLAHMDKNSPYMSDITNNNVSDPTAVPWRFASFVDPYSFVSMPVNTWDQEEKSFVPDKVSVRRNEMDAQLGQYNALANQGFGFWNADREFDQRKQANAISAQQNNLLDKNSRLLAMQNITNGIPGDPTFTQNWMVDKNGKLVPNPKGPLSTAQQLEVYDAALARSGLAKEYFDKSAIAGLLGASLGVNSGGIKKEDFTLQADSQPSPANASPLASIPMGLSGTGENSPRPIMVKGKEAISQARLALDFPDIYYDRIFDSDGYWKIRDKKTKTEYYIVNDKKQFLRRK